MEMNVNKFFLLIPFAALLTCPALFAAGPKEINPLPGEEIVTFDTGDGKKITASLFYPAAYDPGRDGPVISTAAPAGARKYPAVVLLPMWLRDRYDFLPLIEPLREAGFLVLSIDYSEPWKEADNLYRSRYMKTRVYDAAAAYSFMLRLSLADKDNISVAGASIGSSMGIDLCSRLAADRKNRPLNALVLISPAANYLGFFVDDMMNDCTRTPVLFILEKQDPSRKNNANYHSGLELYDMFKGSKKLIVYDGIGHGTKMLSRQELIGSIIEWLRSPARQAR